MRYPILNNINNSERYDVEGNEFRDSEEVYIFLHKGD